MSVADMLGLGPTRTVRALPGYGFIVQVKPPAWVGDYPAKTVRIDTPEKVAGYKRWEQGELIQRVLPMLSADERAILIDGGIDV